MFEGLKDVFEDQVKLFSGVLVVNYCRAEVGEVFHDGLSIMANGETKTFVGLELFIVVGVSLEVSHAHAPLLSYLRQELSYSLRVYKT